MYNLCSCTYKINVLKDKYTRTVSCKFSVGPRGDAMGAFPSKAWSRGGSRGSKNFSCRGHGNVCIRDGNNCFYAAVTVVNFNNRHDHHKI